MLKKSKYICNKKKITATGKTKYGTIDNDRKTHITSFIKKEDSIESLKKEIEELENHYINEKEVIEKSNIIDKIRVLKDKLEKLEIYCDSLDYFEKNIKIFDKYYGTNENKEELFNSYLKNIAKVEEYKKEILCKFCEIPLILNQHEGLYICEKCGFIMDIIVDADKQIYLEQQSEIKTNSYQRIHHFSELINQFQGKESTEIPDEVFDRIIKEFNRLRLVDLNCLTQETLRGILKQLKLNNYYEHIPYILNKLKGIDDFIPKELEERLKVLFKQVQEPFLIYKPKKRKNFLNNNYVIRKLLELLGEDEYFRYFPYFKSKEILDEHDRIWEKICKYNKWQFIASAYD